MSKQLEFPDKVAERIASHQRHKEWMLKNALTVGDLRERLDELDPDALVVVPAYDHQYRSLFSPGAGTANYYAECDQLSEPFEDEDLEKGIFVIPIVVID